MKFSLEKPCARCPFLKRSWPGHLAGHKPSDLTAVILRDRAWPCHRTHEGGSWEALRTDPDTEHCAGAAAFASNISKISRDKEVGLHQRRVGKRADVFQTIEALIQHHTVRKRA